MSSDTPTRLSPGDAARRILATLHSVTTETLPLQEASGRTLAADVVSPLDVPPWDNAAMDGYAARAADLPARRPVSLRVVGAIPAGGFPSRAIGPGECMRIFTGAPMPDGADTVIRQEHATRIDETTVRIDDATDRRRNVRRRGEDLRRGSTVLSSGCQLGPQHLGVLASIAQPRVDVYRRPVVAVLATGNELADLDERDAILAGRRVASSNSYALRAAVSVSGGVPLDLGIARDDPSDLRDHLAAAAAADLVVTSGGMSVGEHDHLRVLLREGGAPTGFWRLRMRPGAPVGFGAVGETPWIGLPGNPVSSMVAFEILVRPAIRRLGGSRLPFRRAVPVRLGEAIETPGRLTHFLRVRLALEGTTLVARTTGPQGSGMLTSMVKADALLIVPEDREAVEAGATLGAIVLDDGVHVDAPPF